MPATQRPATRRGMRAAFALLAVAAALAAPPVRGQAINDVPMAVKNNVAPNFMFMIDDSGSMNNIVPGAPYDAAANYTPAGCSGASVLGNAAVINIRLVSGEPRFRVGSGTTNHQHWSLLPGDANSRCFDRTTVYAATLLAAGSSSGPASGMGDADYDGNFLNWYFGNAGGHPVTGWTDRKRLTSGSVRTRMEVAKAAAGYVIGTLPLGPDLRIGVAAYNNCNGTNCADGGKLVVPLADFTGTQRTNVLTGINGLAPGGFTPLAETLTDIGRYLATGYSGAISAGAVSGVSINDFLRQNGRESCLAGSNCQTTTTDAVPASPATGTPNRPIQYWCQRSYALMMTDGRSTKDIALSDNVYLRDYDGDCSGVNAASCAGGYDKKTARSYESSSIDPSDYLDDVAKALFDVDLRPNLPAPAGRTKRSNVLTYTIGFADTQVQNDALLINAAAQGGGRFLNAQDEGSLVTAFRASMVDSFAKDAAAAAVAVVNAQITLDNIGYASSYKSAAWFGDLRAYALDTTTGLPIEPAIWSLRDRLAAQGTAGRRIVSYDGSVGRPFTAAQFGGSLPSLTAGVVDYVRGARTGEDTVYRSRQYVLGDIVNAEPLVVSYPGGVPILYQGANDGMLHVVDGRTDGATATRGQELWAYVPRLLHARLADLADPAYSHRYYVDATPAAVQVSGLPFTRLLVGGLGKGGRGYYALDISSYAAASEAEAAGKVQWEFTHANMGYTFGTPQIVRTAAGWRVVVTSGYDNGGTSGGDGGGHVWVLDPASGAVLATLSTGAGTAASPSGLAHLGRVAHAAPDALVRFLWGGDLLGNVWRFDLDTLTVVRIASLTDPAGATQPVTAPPEVTLISGSTTKFNVMVGTGRYLADEDVPGNVGANAWAAQRQSLYGLFDDTTLATPSLPNLRGSNGATCPAGGGSGDLVCQSAIHVPASNSYQATTHAVNPATRRGWYVDLPADANLTHGRIVGKPALTTGGTLVATVNVPTSQRCDPGGSSWLLALSATTGGAVPVTVGGDTFYDAAQFLGFALASRPVILQTAGRKRALMRMYDTTFRSVEVGESNAGIAPWRRIYWRSMN